jgi:Peptidase MA superfamily
MRRAVPTLAAMALVGGSLALGLLAPAAALGFSGFGAESASATYGRQIIFTVELPSGAPDRLEVLLQVGLDADATVIAPVEATGATARYSLDTATDYLTPNTPITYRWRATVGSEVTLSPEATFRYADNRPGLDWKAANIGQATVHWYGDAESQARRFGDLSTGATSRAEAMLGHSLDGRIDIFVYKSRDEFFGALGPGAREWTGAATYPDIRTVFMWLGGGPSDYLDTALAHEVTHVVFFDATRNPYHSPASWLNEGFAVWSERQNADEQAAVVRNEASSGLFSFSAITGQFPIGERGSSLSYAQGTTMVARIIGTYGSAAMARITGAYRGGATDAEALQAGTGISADQLYADYFRSFGAAVPKPVAAASIAPSIVHTGTNTGAVGSGAPAPNGATRANRTTDPWVLAALAAFVVVLAALVAGAWIWRRRRSGEPGSP